MRLFYVILLMLLMASAGPVVAQEGAAPKHDVLAEGTDAGKVRTDNGLRLPLIWCPPGTFMMGQRKKEVTLTTGFWIGKYEVTRTEWREVMNTKPWELEGDNGVGGELPASNIGHTEATNFCDTFTQRERKAGRLPSGWQYALPTEAQWEYACRAGTTDEFYFARTNRPVPNDRAIGRPANSLEQDLMDHAWIFRNTTLGGEVAHLHPVGKKKPNPWGLHDVYGNVHEWCAGAFYDWTVIGGVDPMPTKGAQHEGHPFRPLRGGDFFIYGHTGESNSYSRKGMWKGYGASGFRIGLVRNRE